MKLTVRRYQNEDDYWRIRAFLREVFLLNGRRERSWQVARLDYWRWHGMLNCEGRDSIDDVVFLWETADGRIGAVLNPEGSGEAFLQVHPGWRTRELEREMIALAEEQLAVPGANGRRKLYIWAHGDDSLRQDILMGRGYTKRDFVYYERARPLDLPVPAAPLAPGYTVRPLGGEEELPARSWVSWRAFHPDEPDEKYEGWEWYHNVQRMPLYRRDLDIVAVAPDGEFAAFCTVWYDDVTRTGCFEPVGAAPEHHRRGLGKAVMCAGLRRLKRLGGTLATVAGASAAANALYAAVMGTDYELTSPWFKEW